MEKDQKIQLLLDMQEHPEQFSEQELKTMLDDPEVREMMEATALLKQAMMNEESNVNDVDAEWQRFAQAHLTENHPERRWVKTFCETKRLIRAAATFIGILMITGIAFATIHIIRQQDKAETEQTAESTATANTSVSTSSHPNDTIPHNVVRYEEATLEQIKTHDVVLWEKHGTVAVGTDIMDAFDQTDVLCKAANIYMCARSMGSEPDGMTAAQMKEVQDAFNLPKKRPC